MDEKSVSWYIPVAPGRHFRIRNWSLDAGNIVTAKWIIDDISVSHDMHLNPIEVINAQHGPFGDVNRAFAFALFLRAGNSEYDALEREVHYSVN